jgi:hypothetical protein
VIERGDDFVQLQLILTVKVTQQMLAQLVAFSNQVGSAKR